MGRALVLGGGGVAGIAWEAGIVAGLREAGTDLGAADLFVGTSAGSVVGTLLAHGADIDATIEEIADIDRQPPDASVDPGLMMKAFEILFDTRKDPKQARREVGALALSAGTDAMAPRLAQIADRLPDPAWPDRPLLVTAVDTADGAFKVWDRDGAASLADAVMSSCTVPCVFPPVEIDGRRYMDGGTRSATNADLAKYHDRVVILEPMAYLTPREVLDREVNVLGDARVTVIGPDQAAIDLFGFDFLNPTLWRTAFQAGLTQAKTHAEEAATTWNA
ncbi:patatin-like phospholipase family protein [Actinomadura flavalba]|uniref:patatin-like phospholipase family protein n=1 Tax=Actinomadura flavalba TaxID=1120938 RepID=UPI000379B62B|nr:patatin-like phospholipase family protein [Actinomadura flavalba]